VTQLKKLKQAHQLLSEIDWRTHMRQSICDEWANSGRLEEQIRLRQMLDLVDALMEGLRDAR
jgi:hypothetical protein